MDDTTRSSTYPPVPHQFPMRRVGDPPFDRDLFAPLEEQRTLTGVFPVARSRDVQSSNVTSLLARRLKETTFTDMVMWVDRDLNRTKVGIMVAFTPQGTFVPHLLELIEEVEIGGHRYRRLPKWDGSWGSDEDGRHDVYLVVEMSAEARPLPLMSRDVRFVFRDAS